MKVLEARHHPQKGQVAFRQHSQFWNLIIKKILGKEARDINLIAAAYEGGHRLERREANITAAFTYGKKLKYSEIDDPQYICRLLSEVEARDLKIK